MKRSGAALLFISVLFFSFTTKTPDALDTLEWNEYRPLTWEDFKGKRAEDAAGDAGTVVQIKAKPYQVKDEIHYEVAALFVKNKSWTDAQSPDLLAHEQLHFDIAELYARKIRKEIKEMQKSGDGQLRHYNLAIEELLRESNEIDIQYDLETLHGAMLARQKEWSDDIKQQLLSLENFKKEKQVISRPK